MDTVIGLVLEYRAYIGFGLLILLGLVCLTSEKFRSLLKKGIIFLLIAAALGFCYYLFTGQSPSDIPSDVNRFFNKRPTELEPSHRYYRDQKEHYTLPAN